MSNQMFMSLLPGEWEIVRGVVNQVIGKIPSSTNKILSYMEDCGGDHYEVFRRVRADNPQIVSGALDDFAIGYNHFVNENFARHPKTVDAYWQDYRRNQTTGTLFFFPGEGKSDSENDILMAKDYAVSQAIIAESSRGELLSLTDEPKVKFLEIQKDGLLGFDTYNFDVGEAFPFKTLWDIRQEEIPRFNLKR
jgi:hypothetical protein